MILVNISLKLDKNWEKVFCWNFFVDVRKAVHLMIDTTNFSLNIQMILRM